MGRYEHITINERETIFLMRGHGDSLLRIASHTKKSYSTISRELSRDSAGKSYSPSKAQKKHRQCKEKLIPAIRASQSNIPKTGVGLTLDSPVDTNGLFIPAHDC